MISCYYREMVRKKKEDIAHTFLLAEVMTRYMVRKDEKEEIPHPWEYYPELFEKESIAYYAKKEQDELEDYKEARKRYVAEFNRRRQD